MGQIRSCVVSYQDQEGVRHSVEVTAETLYEAAILGLKALRVRAGDSHNITIEIKVKQPETTHAIWGSVLEAWLARPPKNPKEQALKARLKEIRQA